ncbi:MAG: DUF2238 domain-containing protein [bacterium]|nr:DUF2238 domain-containing protein [bacterium]MDZ4295911.1 DUF2238 domain-containing protein [Patescibacteria group bacterium]
MVVARYATIKSLARAGIGGLCLLEIVFAFHPKTFRPDFTWLGLIITATGTLVGLEAIAFLGKHKGSVRLLGAMYLLSFLAVGVDAAGDMGRLYSRLPHFDRIAHFLAGPAVGVIVYYILRHLLLVPVRPRSVFLIIALALSLAIAYAYEVQEYTEDRLRGSRRLGDGPDTVEDMGLTVLGAGLPILFLATRRHEQRYHKRFLLFRR